MYIVFLYREVLGLVRGRGSRGMWVGVFVVIFKERSRLGKVSRCEIG